MRSRHTAAIALAAILVITACGGDGEESATEDATTVTGAAASAEPTGDATAASAEPTGDATGEVSAGATAGATGGDCTLDEPVPVGVVFSLTEGAAVYGQSQEAAVRLAADELNAAGGVTYELVIEDDASDPSPGITAFEKLINQDGVSAIIGPTLSNTAFSTDPVAQNAEVVVLGVSNTAEGVTEMGDFVFRDSLTEGQVIPQTIEASKEELGLERVAVLYGDDDAFTESGYQVFAQALADNDIEITTEQTFAKGDTDFSAQLTEAGNTDPDALVVSALAEEAALILTQAADLGLDIPVIGGNGFNSPALIDNAGDAAEGVIVGAAWNSAADDQISQDFKAAYEEATGNAPDQFAAQAYTGMKLVDAAVRSACSSDPTAIRDAMAGLSGMPTALGEFSFTESRDADHPAVVQVVEGGEFTVLGG